MSFHTLIAVGNVGRDPDSRFTPNGQQVCNFTIAVNEYVSGEKSTLWVRVSAWGKLAETCQAYIKKGSKILVEGRLVFDTKTGGPKVWQGQSGSGANFEIMANTVRFLSSKDDSQHQEQGQQQAAPMEQNEIPF
jgi:single-strand DNA-binding protein